MKVTIFALALSATFTVATARADDTKAPVDLRFNAGIISDYRYRGISQTRLAPALQGGVDFADKGSGIYVGAWTSTIKWTKDAGGNGDIEIDIYAGKRGDLSADLGYDWGVLIYAYPSNQLSTVPGFVSANTTELYGQLSYGPALLKYSLALTNLFGFVDSKNSGYLDLAANLDAGAGLIVNLHAGHQRVSHNTAASYSDWKIGVTRNVGAFTGALAYIGSNAGKLSYASPANGKFLGKSALVLTLSKTF